MHRALATALVAAALGCGPRTSSPTTPATGSGGGSAPVAPPDAAVAIVDAGPPPPLDRDLPRLAARSVALYEAIAAAFRTAGVDCAAAAQQLAALRTEYADVTAANAKVLHEGRAKELKSALAPYDDKLDAAAKEIVGSQTMARCTGDRAFTTAFDDLVGAPP